MIFLHPSIDPVIFSLGSIEIRWYGLAYVAAFLIGIQLMKRFNNKIQENINDELKSQKSNLLVNLASKEYFSVLGKMPEDINVVSPVFKDYKNGQYKIISFYAKKVRGTMTNWLIKNKIKDAKSINKFAEEGYYFSKELSTPTEPVFLRD